MNHLKSYRNIIIKIKNPYTSGSGVLFQSDNQEYSYVITAKHCLEDEQHNICDKKEISICFKINDEIINLYAKKIISNKVDDLAVILVEKTKHAKELMCPEDIENIHINDEIYVFGFPEILNTIESSAWDGHRKKVRINGIKEDEKKLEILILDDLKDGTNTLAKVVEGYSGSGVFLEKNNQIYLIGIYVELKTEDGTFDAAYIYTINAVNSLLKSQGFDTLVPEFLSSFDNFVDLAFEGYLPPLDSLLKGSSKRILQLTPKDIAYKYKEKLFFPTKKDWELTLQDKNIWGGWLEVLTFNYLETNQIPDFRNNTLNMSRLKEKDKQNIKLYYFENLKGNIFTTSSEFYHNNYDELKKNDVILINSSNQNYIRGVKRITEDHFNEGLLHDISKPHRQMVMAESLDIYEALYKKNIVFIHLGHFRDEIAKINPNFKDAKTIMNDLKNIIRGAFEND